MYQQPPLTDIAQYTTDAVANTAKTETPIAAPGNGLALRIVGAHIAARQSNTGNLRIDQTTGGAFVLGTGVGGGDDCTIPYPGIQLGDNQALQFNSTSNIATQGYSLVIYYFIDFVV